MIKFVRNHPFLFLSIFFFLLYLAGNQFLPITDTAESNYAETAREMVLAGDWISPQIYGNYWYDKPILYYWELCASYTVFGFTEFASRLPSAVFGTMNVLFIFWFSRRVYGEKIGWVSALIFGSSVETWLLSKAVITDATLIFFMSAAVAFFYLGYTENRKYYFLCYAAAAMAVLTKGPVGLVLPGLAALLFLLYRRDLSELCRVHLFSGLCLFLLIAGPWYGIMCLLHGSDFLLNFIGVHNILRATVAEHPAHNRWYFNLLCFLVGFAPWSFLLPYTLFRRWKQKELGFRSARKSTQLLVIYTAVVFVFFQLIATKYTTYTYPALFAVSILTALLFERISPRMEKAALGSLAVLTVVSFSLAPSIMLQRSGKEAGCALAAMDTADRTIAFTDRFRTSTVFYSGKTIYRAEPANRIDSLKPGGLSWNAKNVMPFISLEEVTSDPDAILIADKNNHSSWLDFFRRTSGAGPLLIPGEYTIWLRTPSSPSGS